MGSSGRELHGVHPLSINMGERHANRAHRRKIAAKAWVSQRGPGMPHITGARPPSFLEEETGPRVPGGDETSPRQGNIYVVEKLF